MRRPWTRFGGDVQVEGYRILDEIGFGGFSTVLVAEEIAVGRKVALKVARSRDGEARRRFAAEAEIGQRWAATQGIVGILGLTHAAGGWPVLVMPFYDQGTAADLLPPDRRLPVDEVVDLIRQVARGLDAMHRQRYVHRDVSPRNVLISSEMGCAIGDLGCARPSNSTVQPPWTEALTPGYAAPEASDSSKTQTISSDVYGLAATTWALITGAPPHGHPPDPSAIDLTVRYELLRSSRPAIDPLVQAGLPAFQADLLASALDPDPTRRPAGVLDLADGLPGGPSGGLFDGGAGDTSGGLFNGGSGESGLLDGLSGSQTGSDSTVPIPAAPSEMGPIQPPAVRTAVADSTHLVGQPAKEHQKTAKSPRRRRWPIVLALAVVLMSFVLSFFVVGALSDSQKPGQPVASPHQTTSAPSASSLPLGAPIDDLRIIADNSSGVRLAWTPAADPDLLPVLQRATRPPNGTVAATGWSTVQVDLKARSKRVRVDLPNPQQVYCFRLMLFKGADLPVASNQVCTSA